MAQADDQLPAQFPDRQSTDRVLDDLAADLGLIEAGQHLDATLINAPRSTKNKDGKRAPEMHQTKKSQQYYFGMNAHLGVNDESGLVHSMVGTAANVAVVAQFDKLLLGTENVQRRCL